MDHLFSLIFLEFFWIFGNQKILRWKFKQMFNRSHFKIFGLITKVFFFFFCFRNFFFYRFFQTFVEIQRRRKENSSTWIRIFSELSRRKVFKLCFSATPNLCPHWHHFFPPGLKFPGIFFFTVFFSHLRILASTWPLPLPPKIATIQIIILYQIVFQNFPIVIIII